MRDTVYRDEAIEAIRKYQGVVDKSVATRLLTQLPEANGIVRCWNCKNWKQGEIPSVGKCVFWGFARGGEYFCADGRRVDD